MAKLYTKQDYEFTDVIPEDCLCIICMDVLQEPQLTDCCGQHFCKACLEKSLQTTASHRVAQTGGLGAGSQGMGGDLFVQTTASHREAQTGGLGAVSQGMGGGLFVGQTTANHREAQTGGLGAVSQGMGGGLFVGQTTANHTEAQTGGLGAVSQGMGGGLFVGQTTANNREAQTGGLQYSGLSSTSSQLGGLTRAPLVEGFPSTSSKFGGLSSTSSQFGGPECFYIPAQMGGLQMGGLHVRRHSANRVSKQCPHCRTNNFKYMINLPLERKIKDLKVHCPNKGCNHMIRRGDVESHKQKCDFLSVKCTNSCGMAIMKIDLQFHCQNKCSKRKVACQYCGQSGTHEAITSLTHTSSCPDILFCCDNFCGALKMKRKNLSQHKQICPEETVSCTFAEAGCTVTTKRKDLDSHVTANVQQHLSLLMTAYMTIKQELQSLKPLASTKFRAAHNHF